MIVHVPMAASACKNVLVIGGGDGGWPENWATMKKLRKSMWWNRIGFLWKSAKNFSWIMPAPGDKRVSIYYEDGLKFLRLKQNEYDLIINDAIDPLGHNAGLFTKEFYGNCYESTERRRYHGVSAWKSFYDEDEESWQGDAQKGQSQSLNQQVYQGTHSDLFFGILAFGFASKKYHPLEHLDAKRWKERHIKTWYYTNQSAQRSVYAAERCRRHAEEEEDCKNRALKSR